MWADRWRLGCGQNLLPIAFVYIRQSIFSGTRARDSCSNVLSTRHRPFPYTAAAAVQCSASTSTTHSQQFKMINICWIVHFVSPSNHSDHLLCFAWLYCTPAIPTCKLIIRMVLFQTVQHLQYHIKLTFHFLCPLTELAALFLCCFSTSLAFIFFQFTGETRRHLISFDDLITIASFRRRQDINQRRTICFFSQEAKKLKLLSCNNNNSWLFCFLCASSNYKQKSHGFFARHSFVRCAFCKFIAENPHGKSRTK